MSIKNSADKYEKDYGFMAVNAVLQAAGMMHRVHADWFMGDELKAVHDELLRRGLKVIVSKEEYDDGVREHGLPAAFDPGKTEENVRRAMRRR